MTLSARQIFRQKISPLLPLALAVLLPILCSAAPVTDALTPLPAGGAKLRGPVGEKIAAVVRARYASEFARKEVYPETAEALHQRIDDRIPGGRAGYWQGEFWGKWMLGAVAAARYTGDARLREFIRAAGREAIATQDTNGYIGTYSKPDSTKAWNIWSMKYTLWALVEAHELLGDADLLAAARREMDYLMTFVGPGQADIVKTGEEFSFPSSSILQPLLFLHRDTGDKRYLDYAEYIVARWAANSNQPPAVLLKGLAGEKIHDWFPNPSRWAKAYELIHCVEGLAELYRATGKADYLRAAENVAADLIANERTISGNISLGDRLNHAPLNPEAYSEVCDAVYYARLCAQLLQLTGKVVYANELERTFYNSLCAAANADGDWVAGHLSLKAAHVTAPMHCLLNHQHCCVANAPRGLLQAAEHAVMTGKDGATFNLYLPGDFALALPGGDKLKLAVQTDYPATGSIHITVNPATAKTFSVSLRIPDWSAKTTVKVNGQPLPGVKANSYFPIRREWKAGDRIELNLDLRGRVTKFPDAAQSFVAVERGPLVLARDSLLRNDAVNSAVALAADKDGFIPLQPARAPKGFWLTFTAPLVGGGSIPMCDYASVGEIYKRQITNLFSSPARPGLPSAPPKPGVVADSAEDFRVWLPTVKQNAAIQEWNFDQSGDLQGWQANAHLKNVAVTNGALVARADGSDPILELKPLLDLPAAADQVVEIRLKSDRSGEAEWFWSNTAAGKYGGFSGEKSTRFNVLGDGQWHTYRLLPCWHAEGRIVRLRLDVFDGARFELDFIRIVQLAMSPAATGADFDFSRGAQGWQWLDTVVEKTSAPWPGGKFRSTSAGELLSPPLKFDAEENNWVSVRMAVDQGRYGTIFFATKKSSRLHQYNFPIQADGREHTYNLDLLAVPDWRGEIVLLGLRPGEAATPADVRWLKAGDAPQGPAQLTVRAFGLENALPRAGAPLTLAAFIANNGGKPATNLQPQLTLPTGVKILSATNTTSLADGSGTKWTWSLRAEKPLTGEAKLTVTAANVEKVSARAPLKITAKLPVAQNGYVPEPQPVRGPFEVGVYYFPGWNTTARWQPLESYLERRPVLGCYREGDSEVADWHIKWAVEHGITFFAYDWYWSQGTRSLDHALHDGYFKARYRSLLKFCLLWANHNPPNTSSLADCLAVTRYWIENYFRRPEHLTVDGKLAVIIFAPSRLAEDLGHAGVKPVLEAMRAECRAAGLPGLHLIACVSDAASARAAAEQGYDAVTSYNWVHLGMTDDSNYAPYENLLGGYHTNWLDILRQSSAPLSPLPICGGWDARPWHGENTRVRFGRTPELFKRHLLDAKQFAENPANKSKIGNLLLVEAWNEFGEGSYIEPHGESGFGYLDAIREVFTAAPAKHADVTPADAGRGPYDVPPTPPVLAAWDFAGGDAGWKRTMGFTNVAVRDGALAGDTSNSDPAFFSPAFQVLAREFGTVVIRMKLQRADGAAFGEQGLLFWRANQRPETADASEPFAVSGDGQWHEYAVPVAANRHWRGNITGLRIDPCSQPGVRVEISSVRLR